jgi:hypothetical protein
MITQAAVVATIIVLLIIIYYVVWRRPERMENNADKILTTIDVVMKEGGTIVDFKRYLGDPSFSPTKYIHLADLHRGGKLTKSAIERVLGDATI